MTLNVRPTSGGSAAPLHAALVIDSLNVLAERNGLEATRICVWSAPGQVVRAPVGRAARKNRLQAVLGGQ